MLRQFLALFAGTFFISLFVLMMQFLWKYVADLIGKGLSLEVLAQFFWYMALMLVPTALPLAVLLASLITMGNLGESSELTAIKASGISLLKAMRALIVATACIALASFYFQNNIGPQANVNLKQLLLSMKQKSPELEIPEEIFYSGIPNCNLYVQHKDLETGMLYGIMIYRMTQSYEDAAIILADSGRLQSTEERKHLLLTLYDGEWFENMRSQELAGNANVPYRRESFSQKVILLDFDNGFNMAESSGIARQATSMSISELAYRIDSLHAVGDSAGHSVAERLKWAFFPTPKISKRDSVMAVKAAREKKNDIDSTYMRLPPDRQQEMLRRIKMRLNGASMDLEFAGYLAEDVNRMEREYKIEILNKITLSLTCLIFFFIGAPLGAIIRKGGLGVPVIVAVLVFILFYILDNSGYRMAKQASWSIAFGKGLAPSVLIPLAVFVTYKANKDSVVFNMDAYRTFFMKLLGMRLKRHVDGKEVIINDPDYQRDMLRLNALTDALRAYSHSHHLKRLPNPIKVFFVYQPDHDVEKIAAEMESILEDLGNTRDKYVLSYINRYPIISEKAHTRPFDHRWMNIVAAIIVPVGIVLYLRMWRFRMRLYKDTKQIRHLNDMMIKRITEM
ncbi:MAG: LptF/LptG family permease [Prevotella sp.]|nr:LptF/LptG family permease [Prevotella sp.]MBR6086316.1 LptF/LptG family permease [Prevotella sp.]